MIKLFLYIGSLANLGITSVLVIAETRVSTIPNLPKAPICAIEVVLPNTEINHMVIWPDKL